MANGDLPSRCSLRLSVDPPSDGRACKKAESGDLSLGSRSHFVCFRPVVERRDRICEGPKNLHSPAPRRFRNLAERVLWANTNLDFDFAVGIEFDEYRITIRGRCNSERLRKSDPEKHREKGLATASTVAISTLTKSNR